MRTDTYFFAHGCTISDASVTQNYNLRSLWFCRSASYRWWIISLIVGNRLFYDDCMVARLFGERRDKPAWRREMEELHIEEVIEHLFDTDSFLAEMRLGRGAT